VAHRQPGHDLDGQQDNQDKDLPRPKLTSVAWPPPSVFCHVNQARAALT
jgi:hypothetical protein